MKAAGAVSSWAFCTEGEENQDSYRSNTALVAAA